MEIYVLHEGKEMGPFTPGKARLLLQQGSIAAADLAWSPGMAKWEPLAEILPPGDPEAELASLPTAQANDGFLPSTPRQRALLTFLGIACAPATTKQAAALLVCDAMENPAYSVRLGQWYTDRLKLHPDLFAAEIQAKRETRAHHYQMLTQTEGAAYFAHVTKDHAQTVITSLDVEQPNWETREATAARDYFFPAIAERFPQLVKPEWQGRLKDLGPTQGAPESVSRPANKPATKPATPRNSSSSIGAALARGLFFGLLILGVAWFVMKVMQGGSQPVAAPPITAPAEKSTTDPSGLAPATPTPAPPQPSDPVQPQNSATPTAPAATPPPPTANPAPMSDAAPPTPTPSTPPTVPPATPSPAPDPLAQATAPMRTVHLARPFEMKLSYGSVTLPTGTPVQFLSQEGDMLRVQYLNNVLSVPASATDLVKHPSASPPDTPPPVSGL